MAVVRIDRSDDPRLRAYARLADARALRELGWFVAEGRFVVERLLRQPGYVIESLLLSDAAHRALEPMLDAREEVSTYVCPSSLFLGLTGHDFHRGCLALVKRPPPSRADDLLTSANALVVLEAVTNADNVGGVFRNAAAFGVDAVLLSPTCADPLYRKAIRTSMAQTLRVPFATLGGVADPWPACLSRLTAQGFELLALTPQAPSIELDERIARGGLHRFALLVGTEGDGLGAEALRLATCRLRIPMRAEVDSLNLAVATGIALQRLMSRATRTSTPA